MDNLVANYDPNICNGFAYHTVEVVLGKWDYKATHVVRVGGNCSGLDVMECAVGNLYYKLPEEWFGGETLVTVVLTNNAGEELLCQDDDGLGEDWLREMVIGVRVIGLQSEEE